MDGPTSRSTSSTHSVTLAVNVVARESARLRGNAPLVLAHTRYGLGIIEIGRHIQAHPHKSAVASCV